ncbi:hypothetical protein SESBI_13190 [Sesbania bispinosa]|nr:hypothetical protein SESBI_13190 [Sesbania bispinosa]
MPPKPQVAKTMDDVAMLKPLRAREKKTKANEKKDFASIECTGTNNAGAPSTEVGSLFDRRFPIENLVERHLNKKEDRARVNKVGLRNVRKKLQSAGAQIAFFGQCVDHGVRNMEKELKTLILKNKELGWKLKLAEAEMNTMERLKTDLVSSKKRTSELLEEKDLKVDEVGAFKHVIDGKPVDIIVDDDEE